MAKSRLPKSSTKSNQKSNHSDFGSNGGNVNHRSNVFSSVEEHEEERRRRVLDAQRKAAADADEDQLVNRIKHHDDYDRDDERRLNGKIQEAKKVKKAKKPKKIKVTVVEAATKIDATASYESQETIQVMRFADYFARTFFAVKNAEFPWTKMFKESTVAKMINNNCWNKILPLTLNSSSRDME